jgi:hypothetical protein
VAGIQVRRVDPGRDLLLLAVADRPEAAEALDGVALRVEGGVEVRLQLGDRRPKLALVIRAPGPADRLDRGGDVGALRVGRLLRVADGAAVPPGAAGPGRGTLALARRPDVGASSTTFVAPLAERLRGGCRRRPVLAGLGELDGRLERGLLPASSASARSGWRRSQRSSRLLNSSWSRPSPGARGGRARSSRPSRGSGRGILPARRAGSVRSGPGGRASGGLRRAWRGRMPAGSGSGSPRWALPGTSRNPRGCVPGRSRGGTGCRSRWWRRRGSGGPCRGWCHRPGAAVTLYAQSSEPQHGATAGPRRVARRAANHVRPGSRCPPDSRSRPSDGRPRSRCPAGSKPRAGRADGQAQAGPGRPPAPV